MSSTGRGAKRNKDDFYETPEWLTEAIIPYLRVPTGGRILEPACGAGAIARILEREFPDSEIVSSDINGGGSIKSPHNFLTEGAPNLLNGYDLIITNPPYLNAQEFVDQAMKSQISFGNGSTGGTVAMLLRLNFLGSRKRAKWWRERRPEVYVSPARPSFSPDGKTDSTEYAWFIWRFPHNSSGVYFLNTEDINTAKIKREKRKELEKNARERAERQTPDVGLTPR